MLYTLFCPLFVPGNRPHLFAKADATHADALCLDLEDAVAAKDKSQARLDVLEFLTAGERPNLPVFIRLNALKGTDEGAYDLEAFVANGVYPDGVITSMTSSAAEIDLVTSSFGTDDIHIIALIETVAGINAAAEIAASRDVDGLMFGAADLCAQLRCSMSFQPLLMARSQLVLAAAAADIQLIDAPWLQLDDESGLCDETRAVRDLGFTGKAAVHPRQVDEIRRCFQPTAKEVERAQRIVAAMESDGVVQIDGAMVDAPIARAMHRVLQAHRALGSAP